MEWTKQSEALAHSYWKAHEDKTIDQFIEVFKLGYSVAREYYRDSVTVEMGINQPAEMLAKKLEEIFK